MFLYLTLSRLEKLNKKILNIDLDENYSNISSGIFYPKNILQRICCSTTLF